VSLGITTLLLGVPVVVAVLHQGGAVLVLTTALLAFYGLGGCSGAAASRTQPLLNPRP
jgi:heme A synthase